MNVPFLDLKAQYNSIKDDIDDAIQQVINKTAFAGGPFVAQFEKDFAAFCHSKYAVGVNSGTSALWLALIGLGVGPGDEVITAPNSFIATAEAISYCGATPVFVDIDETTYNINPQLIESAITPKTKAIIPVHLFGQTADMDPILTLAKKHNLFVIEDAAQAHGALYKGQPAGSMGDAGCFSFYPGKNLGAYGEGGAVVTNNADLAVKIRMLRDHGQSEKYHHDMIGWNARLEGMQAAVLSVKLKHLDDWNDSRRANARTYAAVLPHGNGFVLPHEAAYGKHIYHVYAVRVKNREDLMAILREQDIGCGIHYPIPIHLTGAYEKLGYAEGSFPVAEKCAQEFLSLPMFPELTHDHILRVADVIHNVSIPILDEFEMY